MQTFEKERYEDLGRLFGYLNSRKPVTSGKGDNYIIVCYLGDYVNRAADSEIRMVSVVDTEQAAHFIARWVKRRDKLPYLPKIYRTSAGLYPSDKGSVSAYLEALDKQRLALKARVDKDENEQAS